MITKQALKIDFGRITSPGDIGNQPTGNSTTTGVVLRANFNDVVSKIIGVLTMVAALWFIIKIIIGGYSIITAGGDKTKISEGRGHITNGLIGLVIVVAAIFLADLVGYLLGLDDILFPGQIIEELGSP